MAERCGHRHVWSAKYDIEYLPLGHPMPADADIHEEFCAKPAGHPVDNPWDAHENAAGTVGWPDHPVVIATFEVPDA